MNNIDKNDLYAYCFKECKISCSVVKKLCKLYGKFENVILSFSYDENLNVYNCSEGAFFKEKELRKIENAIQKIKKEENILFESGKIFYADLIKNGINWTHLCKEDYPKKLKNIEDPPIILFYKGKLPDEKRPSVAIVGARECSAYGEKVAGIFARELSVKGVQIISGMARGIDGIAQRNSIKVNGSTFGILGFGVDVIYPKDNAGLFNDILENGGLISEFLPKTEPQKSFFPARNRIISGLSDIVLVVEARKKSGTYITVTQALEQGRDVYAVPGRITDLLSEGCNSLLANGAGIAFNSDVLIEELKNKNYIFEEGSFEIIKEKTYCVGNSTEERIISHLKEDDYNLEALYNDLSGDISVEELSIALVDMETDGKIKRRGCRFSLVT